MTKLAGWVTMTGCDTWGNVYYYQVWTWDFWWRRRKDLFKVAQIPNRNYNKRYNRRFQGFNHGRHFDRKRRD